MAMCGPDRTEYHSGLDTGTDSHTRELSALATLLPQGKLDQQQATVYNFDSSGYHNIYSSPEDSDCSSDSQFYQSDADLTGSPDIMHQYDTSTTDAMVSHDDHVIGTIKQEGLLVNRTCADPLNAYSFSNGMTSRDPWSFRDGIGLHGNQLKQMNMQNTNGFGSHVGMNDWTSVARTQSSQSFYSPPIAHASTYGHHSPYGWETSGNQTNRGYHYGMSPTAGSSYRQVDGSVTGYPYSSYPGSQNSSPGTASKDLHLTSNPSIQDMDAERTIRRARRNRTCFSKHQLEKLEDVFKESKYPDVYRREEIAAQLDLKEEVVRVWFKNRRAKLKRESKDGKVCTPSISSPSPVSSVGLMSPKPAPTYPVALYPTTYPSGNAFSPMTAKPTDTSLVTSQGHSFLAPNFGYPASMVPEHVTPHVPIGARGATPTSGLGDGSQNNPSSPQNVHSLSTYRIGNNNVTKMEPSEFVRSPLVGQRVDSDRVSSNDEDSRSEDEAQ